MTTDIELVQTALAEFDKVAAGLDILNKNYAGVIYDVETPAGLSYAKAARVALRTPRYEIERIRKATKAPLIAIGKRLDGEAARITAEIMKLEQPIDDQIKAEETRKEREKQALIEAEAKRKADIQGRLDGLRAAVTAAAAASPDVIALAITELEAVPVDESFEEFRQQAEDAKAGTLAKLRELHASAVERAAEQARIKAEREELAKLRAEQEKRDAAERARIAEEERAAKSARDAEAAKQAAELARQREALAEQQRAQQAQQAQEAEKLRAEREAFEQAQAAARQKQEAEDAQRSEEARIAAIKKPSDTEIIRVLADHYRVPPAKVKQWLTQMKAREAA